MIKELTKETQERDRFGATQILADPSIEPSSSGQLNFARTEILAEEAPLPKVPYVLGRYRLEKLLGKGGFGAVYLAHDTQTGELVAVKYLYSALSKNEATVRRFRSAAEAAKTLEHANIGRVHGFESHGNEHILVMEYIAGPSLRQILNAQKGPLDVDETIRIAIQLCDALQYAHQHNLIHRDIKPSNILIANDGTAKLTDFDIAKIMDPSVAEKTATGIRIGSAYYMAPEQIAMEEIDYRADVFSLGVVLYEMVTGVLPVGFFSHPRDVNPLVPKELGKIVLKCLSPVPSGRYQSTTDLKVALMHIGVDLSLISVDEMRELGIKQYLLSVVRVSNRKLKCAFATASTNVKMHLGYSWTMNVLYSDADFEPISIAVDFDNNIYVAYAKTTGAEGGYVEMYDPGGRTRRWQRQGSVRFIRPYDIAVTWITNHGPLIYVLDRTKRKDKSRIIEVDVVKDEMRILWGGRHMIEPSGIAVEPEEKCIFAADSGRKRILKLEKPSVGTKAIELVSIGKFKKKPISVAIGARKIYAVCEDGSVHEHYTDGWDEEVWEEQDLKLNQPRDIVVDEEGIIYIAEVDDNNIECVSRFKPTWEPIGYFPEISYLQKELAVDRRGGIYVIGKGKQGDFCIRRHNMWWLSYLKGFRKSSLH